MQYTQTISLSINKSFTYSQKLVKYLSALLGREGEKVDHDEDFGPGWFGEGPGKDRVGVGDQEGKIGYLKKQRGGCKRL